MSAAISGLGRRRPGHKAATSWRARAMDLDLMLRPRVSGLLQCAVLAVAMLAAPHALAQETKPADAAAPGPAASEPAVAPKLAAEGAPVPRPLLPPADPKANGAYKVLETHCARCHQDGRLKRARPAAAFGNILRLDEIAGDPSLVRPGNPDASRLYTHILRRLMPFDVHQESSGDPEPSADELQRLRTWIAALPQVPACQDRRPVTMDMHVEALRRAAEQAGPAASRLRFVSLAHLYNACATPEAMFSHRQAVLRLFNSLSWKPTPVRVEPVDPARTLLRIDLDDLGWLPSHWERILRSGPNGPGSLAALPKPATEPFGVAHPVVRGDWLAHTILKAPLYYDLLGLPELSGEIARILQIDPEALRRSGNATRDVVRSSAFSDASRVIERLAVLNRVLWTAYSTHPRDGRRDITDTSQLATAPPPPHDAALSLFMLPNGLPGFFVANASGERLARVPPDIARPSVAARTVVRPGLDCMSCHGTGPAPRASTVTSDIDRLAERDRDSVRDGLISVGIEPGFRIDGVEPVTALAREFQRPLAVLRASAELGLGNEALAKALDDKNGRAGLLLRRLIAGLVGRAEFETEVSALLAGIVETPLPGSTTTGVSSIGEITDPGPQLILLSDKAEYRSGDPLRLTVRTKQDCHLTVISIDQRGRGTVIFPSDFEANNFLTAGRELKLPADGAPYLFRVKEKGRENIVAVCSPTNSAVYGIKHDFERLRFTDLGDFGVFLAQAYASSQPAKAAPGPAPQAQPQPPDLKAKGRRRPQPRPEQPADTPRPPSDQLTHTAITIEVR